MGGGGELAWNSSCGARQAGEITLECRPDNHEDRWRAKKKKKKEVNTHNPNSLVLVVVQISECVHFQWSILHILFNAPQNRVGCGVRIKGIQISEGLL